jgi:hypothetical protein
MSPSPHYHVLKQRHDSLRSDWQNQARNDPEFGGKDFDENLRKAKKVIHRFGNSALKDHLNHSGQGDNPELLRFIWKIAQELDRLGSKSQGSDPKDWGKIFYPNFPNP